MNDSEFQTEGTLTLHERFRWQRQRHPRYSNSSDDRNVHPGIWIVLDKTNVNL